MWSPKELKDKSTCRDICVDNKTQVINIHPSKKSNNIHYIKLKMCSPKLFSVSDT